MSKTMDQHRAEYALRRVKAVRDMCARDEKEAAWKKRFKAYVRNLPCMIQTNGLGQAAAFCLSKGKPAGNKEEKGYWEVYNLLSEWLCSENSKGRVYITRSHRDDHSDDQHLLFALTDESMGRYIAAEAEAQAMLQWAKRFADALIEGEPDLGDGGSDD